MDRRKFFMVSGVLAATALIAEATNGKTTVTPIKAALFDGFPIFDPRPIFKLVLQLFPEKGNELVKEWRTRHFEYTWLRTMTGKYKDFFKVTEDALMFAANLTGLEITEDERKTNYGKLLPLKFWAGSTVCAFTLKIGCISFRHPF